jgi:thiamine transport system permease protein
MMIREVARYKSSLFFGGVVLLSLLLFVVLIFSSIVGQIDSGSIFSLDDRILSLLKFTIYQAFLSTVFSLLIGLVLAWSLAHRSRFFGRSLLIALFSSSLVLPTLVVAFGIIGIYGRNGFLQSIGIDLGSIYGLVGILLAHIYLNASYATRSLLHSFDTISQNRYKLSYSLGLTTWQRFWYVEAPALKSTLFGVASTIFLLCFSSFAIVLLLGGSPAYSTLEVAIYEAVRIEFDLPYALNLALIQLSIASVVVLISANQNQTTADLTSNKSKILWREKGSIKYFQIAFIILFAIFFISPLVVIVVDGLGADFGEIFSDKLFVKSLLTTLILATISAVLSLVFTLVIADTKRNFNLYHRLGKFKISKFLNLVVTFLSNIYLAISSLILGVGFFLISLRFSFSNDIFAWVVLVVANVLLTLPFSLAIIAPIMQKSAKRYDKLILSLGLSKYEEWVDVDLPYLKGSIIYIFVLSFCFSMGDLGIIALFASDSFSTLPWYLYGLLGSYQSTKAAGVALIMLVITLTLFLIGVRFAKDR